MDIAFQSCRDESLADDLDMAFNSQQPGRLTPALKLHALNGLVHLLCNFTMTVFADINDFDLDTYESTDSDNLSELLNTNWQTTAAVGLSVATGGIAGAVALAAFPAQTIVAGASIGTLAYAGKRRADGKSAFPFMDKSDKKSDEKSDKKSESKSEDQAEA